MTNVSGRLSSHCGSLPTRLLGKGFEMALANMTELKFREIMGDVVRIAQQPLCDGISAINSKIETLAVDVNTLKADVRTLKADVRTLKADVKTLKADVRTLKADVRTLKVKVGTLEVNGIGLKQLLDLVRDDTSKTRLEHDVTRIEFLAVMDVLSAHTDKTAQVPGLRLVSMKHDEEIADIRLAVGNHITDESCHVPR
jgi:outer membrane murein-binding lipoprotein Lpp